MPQNTRFRFWQQWLLITSIVIILFGIVMALGSGTRLFDLAFNRQIDPSFWPGGAPDPAVLGFQRWAYSILGATVAGWGLLIAFIARGPFARKERWAWNGLLLAMLLWYLLDTGISLAYTVYFNALFNTLLLGLVLLPLLFTRREFTP